MAWPHGGIKPLPEPMLTKYYDGINRPQLVEKSEPVLALHFIQKQNKTGWFMG